MTPAQWTQFDADAQQFDLDGDDGTNLYNFWEATGGRATVTMDALHSSLRDPDEDIRFRVDRLELTDGVTRFAEVQYPTKAGLVYRVEVSEDLKNWTQYQVRSGTGDPLTFSMVAGSGPDGNRFIRVKEE